MPALNLPSYIQDSWSTPLEGLPRWFTPNSSFLYSDYDEPSIVAPVARTPVLFSGGAISNSYIAVETTASGVSPLQALFSAFSAEKSVFNEAVRHMYLALSGGFDPSEPSLAWYLNVIEEPELVEVKTSSGWLTPTIETSDFSLFYAFKPSVKVLGNEILLTGLDALQTTATAIDKFSFVPPTLGYTPSLGVYVEHPFSKLWVPENSLREDGWLGVKSDTPVRLRVRSAETLASAREITVRLDGVEQTATCVNLWTAADDLGLKRLISRHEGEDLNTFGDKVINLVKFEQDSSLLDCITGLDIRLGGGYTTTLSASSTGVSVPSTAGKVFNLPHHIPLYERLVINSANECRTRYNVSTGTALVNDMFYTPISNIGGVVTLTDHTPVKTDNIKAWWFQPTWSFSSGTLSIVPYSDQLAEPEVYLSTKVDIQNNTYENQVSGGSKPEILSWDVEDLPILRPESVVFD